MTPLAVIIDCDPGIDDAVALLLALSAPEQLNVLAITTVAGNVSLELTTRNACLIRELAARIDVPIYAGCAQPLRRSPVSAGHFHGESGLGNLPLSKPVHAAEATPAAEQIVELLRREAAQSVTLAVMGPMTNVAHAFALDRTVAVRVKQIVVMGGARREGGNITASAEYNVFADPHAASVVLQSGCPLVVFGLDATHQVRATSARIAQLNSLGTHAGATAATLLKFAPNLAADGQRDGGAPLHDPCTIAWLLAPTLFDAVPAHIAVETESPLTLGHTAVEFRIGPEHPANADWIVTADGVGVFQLLQQRLATLP